MEIRKKGTLRRRINSLPLISGAISRIETSYFNGVYIKLIESREDNVRVDLRFNGSELARLIEPDPVRMAARGVTAEEVQQLRSLLTKIYP